MINNVNSVNDVEMLIMLVYKYIVTYYDIKWYFLFTSLKWYVMIIL